jgi:hypothetical protein
MDGEISAAWLMISLAAGAVGMGMIVYGRRRKEAMPLVFGVVLAGYPYLVNTAWAAALVGVGIIAAFITARRVFR